MARDYRTDKTWSQVHRELSDEFRRWNVQQWDVQCTNWGQKATNWSQDSKEATVFLKFTHPDGTTIQMRMDARSRAIDNLHQLTLGIGEMRNLHRRGLENMVRTAYMQLAAPEMMRDPYEVLGVRPDEDLDFIEAAFKIKAKKLHPDVEGGSDAAMKELNLAIAHIRTERGVSNGD